MNAVVNESAGDSTDTTETPTKAKVPAEIVKMSDGRSVEFAGKRKLLKESVFNEDGTLAGVRMDFRNGETRLLAIPPALIYRFAGHGAEQKYGDATAGEDDVDDMVLAVDDLDKRIQKGEWSIRREGGGMSGTSVLIKALMEYGGRTLEQVKTFLEGKTQPEKLALRNNDKRQNAAGHTVKSIVQRLEAEKVSKAAKVDTDEMLGAL